MMPNWGKRWYWADDLKEIPLPYAWGIERAPLGIFGKYRFHMPDWLYPHLARETVENSRACARAARALADELERFKAASTTPPPPGDRGDKE